MNTDTLMKKVAEVAPKEYTFLVKAAEEIRTSPFSTDTISELDGLIKKAAMGTFGRAAVGLGSMAASGIALSLAGDLYDAAKRGITKGRNYKGMMKENPDLAELPAKDVQKAFATLHHFNPEFAGDPTVAGSFVRRQAALGEFDPKQLTDLIGARKNLSDIRKLPAMNKLPWASKDEDAKSKLELKQLRHSVGTKDPAQTDLFRAQAENARRPPPSPHPAQVGAWMEQGRPKKP